MDDRISFKKTPYTCLLIITIITVGICQLICVARKDHYWEKLMGIKPPKSVDRLAEFLGLIVYDENYIIETDVVDADITENEEMADIDMSHIDDTAIAEIDDNTDIIEATELVDMQTSEVDWEEELAEEQIEPEAEFVSYDPVQVSSPYYRDAGCYALTSTGNYVTVDDSYMDDACLVGDSRTMGIYDYLWPNTNALCDTGYCIYKYVHDKPMTNQLTGQSKLFREHMAERQYSKIYIMIGLNDCGFATTEKFKEGLLQMISEIQEYQNEATIFLIGNMHITREAEANPKNAIFSNININAKNVAIAECANETGAYYLDPNEGLIDDEGYLISGLTFDGFHLYANKYGVLHDFILEHGIEN